MVVVSRCGAGWLACGEHTFRGVYFHASPCAVLLYFTKHASHPRYAGCENGEVVCVCCCASSVWFVFVLCVAWVAERARLVAILINV